MPFLEGQNHKVMNENLLDEALNRADIAVTGLGRMKNDNSTPGIAVNKVGNDNS
jgi:hypothetical protein